MSTYEFTGETTSKNGVVLHRIRRIRDGLLGGWIQSKKNLCPNKDAWVYDNAVAMGNSIVHQNAQIRDNAVISGNASIHGNACVYDDAHMYGNAQVFDYAHVYGYAQLYDESRVSGCARVFGRSFVSGEALLFADDEVSQAGDYVTIGGFRARVTVRRNGVVSVGYQRAPISEWLDMPFYDLSDFGGTPAEFEELRNVLRGFAHVGNEG